MTSSERDAVARLLRTIADRLRAAPAQTLEAAERYQATSGSESPWPYQAGALEAVCAREALYILAVVDQYLTPAPRRRRRSSP